MKTHLQENSGTQNVLQLTINGQQFEWPHEFATGLELKTLASIPTETELFLSVQRPWEDEPISNTDRVNLARPEIEHFYIKKKLLFTIEGNKFEWHKQYITGFDIRKLGTADADSVILLSIQRPWEDEVIADDTRVDLARPGIENFHFRKKGEGILVGIEINDVSYKVKRGKYTVAEIKKIGNLPLEYELEEVIQGKLTPLKDDATVLIKGCEIFFGHVRDGSSS
jgi:hypothetical protein